MNPLPTVNLFQILEYGKAIEEKMNSIFTHDQKLGLIIINAKYPYEIELSRIPDQVALLRWVAHLLEKNWMTTQLTKEFMRRVCEIKGWSLYPLP
jgi:hypothetical protein